MRMTAFQGRTALMAASLAFLLAACSGSTGPAGANGSNGTNGTDGTNGTNGTNGTPGVSASSTGLKVTVTGVTLAAGVPTVAFTLSDDRGYPVDVAGKYSYNAAMVTRFAAAKVTVDANGNVLPYTVLTGTATSPGAVTATPTEVGSGAGTYTYTFPSSVVVDAASTDTHVIWIQASRQTNLSLATDPKTFTAVNQDYSWIPSGTGTVVTRQIVKTDACSACHAGFLTEGTISNVGIHGGTRVNAQFCNVCHNPARASNPAANSAVFVHRIHNADSLQSFTSGNRLVGSQADPSARNGYRSCTTTSPCVCTVALPCTNRFHDIAATYPQDPRRCDTCHGGALQGGQATSRPNRAACGSCHDYVAFDGSATPTCTDPVTTDASGIPVPCKHVGGVQANDTLCAGCHSPTDIAGYHVPVAPLDPCNTFSFAADNTACLATGATRPTPYTNAGAVPAGGMLPAGAHRITTVVGNVLVAGNGNPSIQFKLQQDGADVVFNDPATATEMMTGYIGAPTAFFAFSVPQDGIAAPADFNASGSGYLKRLWNGTSSGASAGTLIGPDAGGFYTATLTGIFVPATGSMVTGGIGYAYNLSTSAAATSQPLTQIDLAAYPYDAATRVGGLVVALPNVWKVATGYTGRRAIVDNAKCQSCHVQLGSQPTFHAGQRNDGPTCSFCHTTNQSSSGWAANAKDAFHSLHAGRVRTTPFMWHAVSATDSFADVEFPSRLNNCLACHVDGTYDFSAPASAAAMDSMLWTTSASGNLMATTVSTSPYVAAQDYGLGFAYNAATNTERAAAGTTLVTSPITAACIACHDSNAAFSHMDLNGGSFYVPRSTVATGLLAVGESCMVCHGTGAVADIKVVHQ